MENNSVAVGNASTSSSVVPYEWQMLFTVTDIVGVVVNVGVIVALLKWQLISSKTTNILLIHQCVADALSSLIATISWIIGSAYRVPENFLGDLICVLWWQGFIFWTIVQVAINNLILFTGERYLSIVHPITHRRLNKKHITVILLLSWLHAIIVSIGFPFFWKREDDLCVPTDVDHSLYVLFVVINTFFFFMLPIAVLIVLNARMIKLLRGQASQANAGHQNQSHHTVSKDLTLTVAIAGTGFIVLVSPNGMLFLLDALRVYILNLDSFLNYLTTYMVTMTCIINPLVYIVRMAAFQRRMNQCCCACRRHHAETSGAHSREVQIASIA